MNSENAILAFAALAHETRLKVFKILLEYGRAGTAAGTLSDRLGIPHNSLSFHLSHLKQAGLITARKDGRSMIYAANCDAIDDIIAYLSENCCALDEGYGTDCKPIK